jgi:hypothetical protein
MSNLDYVVEAWLYIPTLNTLGGGNFFSQMMNVSNNANRQFSFAANSSGLQFYWTTNGISDQINVFSASLPVSQWFHVAFARSSGLMRAYVNGSQVGSTLSNNLTYYDSTADICIGSFGKYADNGYAYLDFIGYIDDLRVTRGSDRGYNSATITLPTTAFNTGPLLTTKIVITRIAGRFGVGGASTFTGDGTLNFPYYQSANSAILQDPDGMYLYEFTANSTGTVVFSFDCFDDDDNGNYAIMYKRATSTSADSEVLVGGGHIYPGTYTNVTVPVIAGNVITFSSNSPSYVGFKWMSIYTT